MGTDTFTDRRKNLTVREIFEEAYTLCEPYLDPAKGINGQPLTRQVVIVLRETYPQLSGQDLVVLFTALQSTFRVRRANARRAH